MDVIANWNGRLNFTGIAESGFHMPLDADAGLDGALTGFKPMELIAIGLAGCTAMDVISILSKKRQEITDFEVQVHADRSENHPKVFTRAVIEYYVTGRNVDEAAVVRSIELSTEKYCPAQAMLNQVMPIEQKYYIYEDLGDKNRRLAAGGEYRSAVGTSP